MRVLVVPASRHGGTAEIGRAMARTLRDEGLEVDVAQPDQMFNLSPYDAHIIGSALYFGRWLESAHIFVEEHAAEIRARPTWLFSSGPIGSATPERPMGDGVVEQLLELTGAVDHRLFGGRIELDRLPTAERFLARWVGATDGDYRDWLEIADWTRSIASILAAEPVGGQSS